MSTRNDHLLQKVDTALNAALDKIANIVHGHYPTCASDVKQLSDAVQSLSYAKWQLMQPVENLLRGQGVMPGLSKSPEEQV